MPSTKISQDPCDHDGRLPKCDSCTDAIAVWWGVDGCHYCEECHQLYLYGEFDVEGPEEVEL